MFITVTKAYSNLNDLFICYNFTTGVVEMEKNDQKVSLQLERRGKVNVINGKY